LAFLLYPTLPFVAHPPKNYENYFQARYHAHLCGYKVSKCLDEDWGSCGQVWKGLKVWKGPPEHCMVGKIHKDTTQD
jgi:hypothetical protein